MSVEQELDEIFTINGEFESGETARVIFYGTSAEAAFALLVQLSQPESLADLARQFLNSVGDE